MRLFDPVVRRTPKGIVIGGGWRDGLAYGAVVLALGLIGAVALVGIAVDLAPAAVLLLGVAGFAGAGLFLFNVQDWIVLEGRQVWIRTTRVYLLATKIRRSADVVDLLDVAAVRKDGEVLVLGRRRLNIGPGIDQAWEGFAAAHARAHHEALEAARAAAVAVHGEVPARVSHEEDGVWRPTQPYMVAALLAAVLGPVYVVVMILFGDPLLEPDEAEGALQALPLVAVACLGFAGWVLYQDARPEEVHAAELTSDRLVVRRGHVVCSHALRDIRSIRWDGEVVVTRLDGRVDRFGAGWDPAARRDLVAVVADGVLRARDGQSSAPATTGIQNPLPIPTDSTSPVIFTVDPLGIAHTTSPRSDPRTGAVR
jgi:hypothetical protein